LNLRLLVSLHLALLRLHWHCVGTATAVDCALLSAACAGAAYAGDDAADDGDHDDAPDCDCPSGGIPFLQHIMQKSMKKKFTKT
jgi:hypothetical protein